MPPKPLSLTAQSAVSLVIRFEAEYSEVFAIDKKMQPDAALMNLNPNDIGTDCPEAAVYIFVSAVYLLNILNDGLSGCRKCCDQKCIARSDIRGNHRSSAQW